MRVAELLLFTVAIAALFASGEFLRRRGLSADVTRRYTHAAGASVAALLPGFLTVGEVIVLAGLVAAFLGWTHRRGLLRSVHAVPRPTMGATLFPIGLALAAVIGWEFPASYTLGALTFAFADPAAAIVGARIESPRWRVWKGAKSLSGSLAFAAVALLLGVVVSAWAPLSIGAILVLAIVLAAAEGSLGFGLDNLLVPPLAVLGWARVLLA